MRPKQRCYSCTVHKFYTKQGLLCNFLKMEIPQICPCYDCIILPTCQEDCMNYENIQEAMRPYLKFVLTSKVKKLVPDFEKKYLINSLGRRRKSHAER